ncbi:MAG: acyl-CoA dehydrogenase family protein [Deltaproteobacteria bacterium]|nr:acyl-CoA dehydrogenase family protein [Deltaproteobacteria bacterium]
MDYGLSEVQEDVRRTFADFSDREIRPVAAELDKKADFPLALFRKVGELGYFSMRYPEPDGSGMDVVSFALATEELARGSLGVAAGCAMQSLMGTTFVHRFTEGALRERLIGPALRGEILGTVCMTEPDSGSDLFSMKTRADERDGTWYITGQKMWITSAPVADMFTVFARTGEHALGVFLVEKGAAGLAVGRTIDKMGVKASVTSEVLFDQTPATAVLGEPDEGGSYLRDLLAEVRVMTGALALGTAQAAFDDALRYSGERRQFGKPINRFGAIQAHLAEMAVDLEAARQMVRWAAWRSDQGVPNEQQASMAKLFASEAAHRICDRAARIMASYGYAEEYAVERYLRDVRFTLIGGGTSELLRVNIARGLSR